MKVSELVSRYGMAIRGIIHVGAHFGQEYSEYRTLGNPNLMFFEPMQASYLGLLRNLGFGQYAERCERNEGQSHLITHHLALGTEAGQITMHTETANQGMSSSILRPKTVLQQYPAIQFTGQETVRQARLDEVFQTESIEHYNMLVIDVQGYEKYVIEGGLNVLGTMDFVITEVNRQELYEGCTTIQEMDILLSSQGFVRIETDWEGDTWGDALYVRTQFQQNIVASMVQQNLAVNASQSNSAPTLTFSTIVGVIDKVRTQLQAHPGDIQARFTSYCATYHSASRAQLFQDLFVLFVLNDKKAGYFVEFGAADGVFLSNTFLLERNRGWRGILAEPARTWHAALKAGNRTAIIDTRCVWSRSGETLTFNQTEDAALSTVNSFSDTDMHSAARSTGERYDVETISLTDLLDFHDAPTVIDYLSIDTEGSELVILENFDFDKYRFSIITVEHNYAEPARSRLLALLTAKGYSRVFENFSRWDDWYLHSSILSRSEG